MFNELLSQTVDVTHMEWPLMTVKTNTTQCNKTFPESRCVVDRERGSSNVCQGLSQWRSFSWIQYWYMKPMTTKWHQQTIQTTPTAQLNPSSVQLLSVTESVSLVPLNILVTTISSWTDASVSCIEKCEFFRATLYNTKAQNH